MDLVSKIYQRLGIDERKDPFKKTASKKSPLNHFGIRNDLDYDYEGENLPKKKEVVSQGDWVQQAFEKLHRIWLQGGGDSKWVPGLQKGTISGKPVLVVTFLPGGEEWAPFDASEVDTFINDINKTTTKKEAILDVLEAPNMYEHLSNRWKVIASLTGIEDPEAAFAQSYDGYCNLTDNDRITLAHSNDYDAQVPAWHDMLMGKKASDDMDKEEAYEKLFQMLSRDTQERIKFQVSDPLPKEKNSAEQKYVLDEIVEIGTPDEQHLVEIYREKYAVKKQADSGPNDFGTKTTDSYTETRHEDHDGKSMDQNYPHGSPIDNNKSVIDDMLTSDPTPTVYAPSESDGILFDTIERANPIREEIIPDQKKEFEGLNARKKQIIASLAKSGQQWEYYLGALNKVKELEGTFVTRKLLDSGFYWIIRDMEEKGFVEFKKVKITGTAPKIIMTDKGKLALTAVEEKMNMTKQHSPGTVSPVAAPADLPGNETPAAGTQAPAVDQLGSEAPGSPDNDANAETEVSIPAPFPKKKTKVTNLPQREKVPAMKTYSVSDIERFAPHIANVMVKSGILFTEKESFDKRYASYINQVKAMPRVNEARLEKKAAELEIAIPLYRKLLFAQEGIKVLSHDEFSKQANVPKPKLYQYKDAGTYVKIGNEEFVVASLTDEHIFLKRAQSGYDTEKEIEESGISTPLNQYLDNRDMKFMVYEKKDDKRGKLLGYGHSHKRARMLGLANGEGNYIVEVINEKVGPPTSNTGSPEIYGIYEYEVRKFPSGGSYPTDGDSLKVMNYRGVNTPETSNHVTKLVQEASKKIAQTRKMYIIYPKGIEGQDEMMDWLWDASDRYHLDYDEESVTMDSAKVWARDISDEQLEQRLKKSGINFSYEETEMPEIEEPVGPRQRGPKLPEEPIEFDEQGGEEMEIQARLTKRGETALRALFKSFERVIRDVTISGKTFEDPTDRKFMLNLMSFVENNLEALSKVAGVSPQEETQMEQQIEQAEEVLESSENQEPVPAASTNEIASPITESPEVAPMEEVKAEY